MCLGRIWLRFSRLAPPSEAVRTRLLVLACPWRRAPRYQLFIAASRRDCQEPEERAPCVLCGSNCPTSSMRRSCKRRTSRASKVTRQGASSAARQHSPYQHCQARSPTDSCFLQSSSRVSHARQTGSRRLSNSVAEDGTSACGQPVSAEHAIYGLLAPLLILNQVILTSPKHRGLAHLR